MLLELTVENIAIIERAQIALGPGFTALTGETGAGKSLLIDAIELALGERADSELVRSGAPRAGVSLVADVSTQPALAALCKELGVPLENDTLYVQRDVFAEGRSQCRIGGRMMPVSVLKQLGAALVDLHGQHDHQSLMHSERHIGFLDSWIGQELSPLAEVVASGFQEVSDLRRKLANARAGQRDREQRLDMLRFQVEEIESVDPQPGELELLESQLSRMQHAERLASTAAGAMASLSEEEGSARDALSVAIKSLEDAERLDASLTAVLEQLRASLYSLDEGVRELRSYADTLESNPEALEEAANRIDSLRKLRRKYGEDEAAVIEYLTKAREELALLEDSEFTEEALEASLGEADSRLAEVSTKLTHARKAGALRFGAIVRKELQELAMERAQFEVSIQPKEVDASGADLVEFFFSANAGEPPRPLAKIASGGEISRVMLAIKSALAGRAGVPTLIFDEVDAGLGGRAAAVVAKKLEQLAQHYQVIVISHLPQIASRATSHFHIEKTESGGRVATTVRELSHLDRVEEIARMLAGETLTGSALENARELLASGS